MLRKLLTHLKAKDLSDLAKGSAWAFLLRSLGILVSYSLLFVIAWPYDASVLGMFTLMLTIVQVFSIIGRWGLDIGVLRLISAYVPQGEGGKAVRAHRMSVRFSLFLSTGTGLVLFFSAGTIAEDWLGSPGMTPYLKCGAVAQVLLSWLFINSESLRALRWTRSYVLLRSVAPHLFTVLFLLVGFFTVSTGDHMPAWAYMMSIVVLALMGHLTWKRAWNREAPEKGEGGGLSLKELLNMAFPMLLSSSLFMIINWTDTLMLGFLKNEEDVGIYNVAYRIANVTNLVLFAVNSIVVPKISASYAEGDMDGLKKLVKRSTFMIFWITLPLVLLIVIFPSFLLGLFGAEFTGGVMALLLILIGKFVSALSGCVGQVLQMTGYQRNFQNIVLTACGLNILLNYALIPLFGIEGAAVASMISVVFWNLGAMFTIKAKLGFFTIELFRMR